MAFFSLQLLTINFCRETQNLFLFLTHKGLPPPVLLMILCWVTFASVAGFYDLKTVLWLTDNSGNDFFNMMQIVWAQDIMWVPVFIFPVSITGVMLPINQLISPEWEAHVLIKVCLRKHLCLSWLSLSTWNSGKNPIKGNWKLKNKVLGFSLR